MSLSQSNIPVVAFTETSSPVRSVLHAVLMDGAEPPANVHAQ
jgi:hypothetical protein